MYVTSIMDFGHSFTYNGWSVAKQKYNFCRMYYITKGVCFYSDEHQSLTLKKNTLYLLPTTTEYELNECQNDKIQHYYVHLTLTFPLSTLTEVEIPSGSFADDVFFLIQKYINLSGVNNARYHEQLLSLVNLFVTHCLDLNEFSDNLAIKVKNYIDENIADDLTMKKISQFFNYSEVHLARIFKKQHSISISKYLHDKKLNHALKLLNDGNSISSIIKSLNFSSEANFSRAFRAKFGLPPRTYLKEQKMKQFFPFNEE